jgi:hypothetical protein
MMVGAIANQVLFSLNDVRPKATNSFKHLAPNCTSGSTGTEVRDNGVKVQTDTCSECAILFGEEKTERF